MNKAINSTPSFGDAFREARKSAGMTLTQASKLFGFSIPYLSDIERNRRAPPTDYIVSKAAKAYGCDEATLLKISWMTRGFFELDATEIVSSLHHDVGAKLRMRWFDLSREQLEKILGVLDDFSCEG